MTRRKLSLLLLSLILTGTVLSSAPDLQVEEVSAAPVSPYIMIIPERTVNATIAPGMNYTIDIYTDYSGSDVWGWQFGLTFNPSVLEGLEVLNGDLITVAKNARARFKAGKFNNTVGNLSLTSAWFYQIPSPPPTTSGPGTLARVKFRVVDIGVSNITLGSQAPMTAQLQGFNPDPVPTYYNIITADGAPGAVDPPYGSDHIGHGYFNNIPNVHDVAVSDLVTPINATLGDVVTINVTLRNEGNFTEYFDVAVHIDAALIGTQAANLDQVTESSRATEKTLTFYWSTAGTLGGSHTINATALLPSDSDLSDNSKIAAITILIHDVAVTSITTSHIEAMAGVQVTINATAANEGYFTETFNITVYVNTTEIGTQPVTDLAAHDEETVTFDWDTTGLELGTYQIQAVASNVTDEANVENNVINSTIIIAPYNEVSYPIEFAGVTFRIVCRSNTVVYQPSFVPAYKSISFNFTAEEGTKVFCNITIPKNLLDAPLDGWTVYVNGGLLLPPELVATENETHTFLSLKTALISGTIEIVGTIVATPPVASFTSSPADPVIGEEMTLNASASYDPDGVIVSYGWDFGDGTKENYVGANLTDTVIHAYVNSGSFIVKLTVTDNKGLQNGTQITVTVYRRDIAILTVTLDKTAVAIGETLTIGVTVKNEGDFPIPETFNVTTYANTTATNPPETVTDLPPGASRVVNFTWDTSNTSPGVYLIKANVTIVEGETETNDNEKMFEGAATITKTSSTISISATPTTIAIAQSTAISGAISPVRVNVTVTIQYRPAGGIWSELRKVTTDDSGQYSCTWTPQSLGVYEAKAKWEGDATTLASESHGRILYVKAPPVASFIYMPSAPNVSDAITFTSDSSDSDSTIVSWKWDFDNDAVVDATTESATWTYDVAGTYAVTLAVTDNDGFTDTITESITVNEPTVQSQPDILPYIALASGIVLIISLVVFYLYKSRKKGQ